MKKIDTVVAQRVWRRVQASSGGTVGDWPLAKMIPARATCHKKATPDPGGSMLLWWILLLFVCAGCKS